MAKCLEYAICLAALDAPFMQFVPPARKDSGTPGSISIYVKLLNYFLNNPTTLFSPLKPRN